MRRRTTGASTAVAPSTVRAPAAVSSRVGSSRGSSFRSGSYRSGCVVLDLIVVLVEAGEQGHHLVRRRHSAVSGGAASATSPRPYTADPRRARGRQLQRRRQYPQTPRPARNTALLSRGRTRQRPRPAPEPSHPRAGDRGLQHPAKDDARVVGRADVVRIRRHRDVRLDQRAIDAVGVICHAHVACVVRGDDLRRSLDARPSRPHGGANTAAASAGACRTRVLGGLLRSPPDPLQPPAAERSYESSHDAQAHASAAPRVRGRLVGVPDLVLRSCRHAPGLVESRPRARAAPQPTAPDRRPPPLGRPSGEQKTRQVVRAGLVEAVGAVCSAAAPRSTRSRVRRRSRAPAQRGPRRSLPRIRTLTSGLVRVEHPPERRFQIAGHRVRARRFRGRPRAGPRRAFRTHGGVSRGAFTRATSHSPAVSGVSLHRASERILRCLRRGRAAAKRAGRPRRLPANGCSGWRRRPSHVTAGRLPRHPFGRTPPSLGRPVTQPSSHSIGPTPMKRHHSHPATTIPGTRISHRR